MTVMGGWVKETGRGASFAVRVVTRASRTAITGMMGDGANMVLKIALAAPPVEGKANEELVAYLAQVLNVPRSSVEVATGKQSKNKVVRVRGTSAAQIAAALARFLSGN